MQRIRRFTRWIGPSLSTLVVGALIGYVLSAFLGPVIGRMPLISGSGESAEARAYIMGMVQRDADALAGLRPRRDVVSRAIELQRASQQGQATVEPTSLTYMGGGTAGPMSVHIYAVGIRTQGQEQLVPFTLTMIGGKVVRIE